MRLLEAGPGGIFFHPLYRLALLKDVLTSFLKGLELPVPQGRSLACDVADLAPSSFQTQQDSSCWLLLHGHGMARPGPCLGQSALFRVVARCFVDAGDGGGDTTMFSRTLEPRVGIQVPVESVNYGGFSSSLD